MVGKREALRSNVRGTALIPLRIRRLGMLIQAGLALQIEC